MSLKQLKKVLIIQLGDIGDVVWTTPTLRAVKKAYPEAQVSLLVREGVGLLLEGDPILEKIFEVKHHGESFIHKRIEEVKFILNLRREHFDLVFDLRAGDRGAVLAYMTRAPIRVSLLYQRGVPFWRNWLFTHLIDPPHPVRKARGAAEQSLKIVRGMGIKADDPTPKLWISEKVRERVGHLLRSEKIFEQPRWMES